MTCNCSNAVMHYNECKIDMDHITNAMCRNEATWQDCVKMEIIVDEAAKAMMKELSGK